MVSKMRNGTMKHTCVADEVWNEWCKRAEESAYKKIHLQNPKNRCGDGTGPSCHTGGSISHITHRERLVRYFLSFRIYIYIYIQLLIYSKLFYINLIFSLYRNSRCTETLLLWMCSSTLIPKKMIAVFSLTGEVGKCM